MDIAQFLQESYTAYHTTANAVSMLEEAGFERLSTSAPWNVVRGGKYYLTRNGSTVIAFRIGDGNTVNIAESHTDSPSFKIKGNKLVATEGMQRLNVEMYGGALMYSFLDRQLKVAGRLVVETPNGVETVNVVSDFNVVIPSLAIHHNPDANKSLSLNAQVDMLPLFGLEESDLYSRLTTDKVLDADLYVVPCNNYFTAGVNNELTCSARIDNLTSAYACISGIINCEPKGIAISACFDNEEVGSGTRQGASSDLLNQVINLIASSLRLTPNEVACAKDNGIILSVDNGHAVHPAHVEKSDVNNKVHLGGGIVIKHHVNYSTDGLSSAIIKKIFADNDIEYQDYYNRSDLRCGSTIGLITASRLSMKACDIGLAQLAMHSACETVATSDINLMECCITVFLSADVNGSENIVTIK